MGENISHSDVCHSHKFPNTDIFSDTMIIDMIVFAIAFYIVGCSYTARERSFTERLIMNFVLKMTCSI